MELNHLTVVTNKRIRGTILALLYSVQPTPVEIRTVAGILLGNNRLTTSNIAPFIDYLSSKKYITLLGRGRTEQRLCERIPSYLFTKLTPDGVDLVEGTSKDQGIEI